MPLHVHLYSDMQQSGMPSNFNDLRLAMPMCVWKRIPSSRRITPNFAVENVIAPRRVYDNRRPASL